MVVMAILEGVMTAGLLSGVFINSGLSISDIKDKCKKVDDLNKQINNVHNDCDKLLNGFTQLQDTNKELYNNVVTSLNKFKSQMDDLREKQRFRVNRQEYIYSCVIITMIATLVTKAILTMFFK